MKLINSIKKFKDNRTFDYYHYFKNYTIYIPPQGLGDFLILLFSLRIRKNKNKEENFAFIAIKRHFKDLCDVFNFKAFYVPRISRKLPKHVENLWDKVYGKDKGGGLKEKTFQQSLAYAVDVYDDFKMDNPPEVKMNPKIQKMFDGYFIKGKSVLICPHATSCKPCFDRKLWINWADELTKKGYRVAFNSEEKFSDYPSMLLNISDTINFLNLAGNLIAYRSGLADVLGCFCDVKNVIIYPNNRVKKDCDNLFDSNIDANEDFLKKASLNKLFPHRHFNEFIYSDNFNPVIYF